MPAFIDGKEHHIRLAIEIKQCAATYRWLLYIAGCSSPGCCLQQRARRPCGGQLSSVAAMFLHLQPVPMVSQP